MSYIDNKFAEIDAYINGSSSDKILEVRSVFTKEQVQNIQPCRDLESGWWAGVARLSDEEKKSRTYNVTVGLTGTSGLDDSKHNTRITLKHGYKFNLNEEVGATNWEWAKYHPALETSFERAQASKANYYIHISGKESENANVKYDLEYEAVKYIMEDDSSKYLNRVLLLGHDLEGEEPAALKEFLIDTAKENPSAIIELYRDKDMRMKLLYVQAKKAGVINIVGEDNIISFGRINLGVTEKAALLYLRENSQVVELIERQIKPQYFNEQQLKQVTPAELAEKVAEENPMPTYQYMKKRAITLGYEGSMKQKDLITYFTEEVNYNMADMKAEEDEAGE